MDIEQKKPGRPKGSTSRPKIRDYMTQEEITEMLEMAKVRAQTDNMMLKFLIEQVFGKAIQPLGGDKENPFVVEGITVTVRK